MTHHLKKQEIMLETYYISFINEWRDMIMHALYQLSNTVSLLVWLTFCNWTDHIKYCTSSKEKFLVTKMVTAEDLGTRTFYAGFFSSPTITTITELINKRHTQPLHVFATIDIIVCYANGTKYAKSDLT